MPDADLSLAVPAVFFGSVGTAGQRCTSTRRLYLHRTIAPEFLARLQAHYASPALAPGDPLNARTLLGPLHSRAALGIYDNAIADLKAAGAQILVGGGGEGVGSVGGRYEDLPPPLDRGNFVRPTIAIPSKVIRSTAKFPSRSAAAAVVDVDDDHSGSLWATERFAPVLLVAEFEELEEAIAWNNAVPQGLSSSLWTRDLRHVGRWIGPAGSDTGIVNVSETFPISLIPFVYFLLLGVLLFRRSMSARAVQKLVLHSVGTRSVLHFCWDAVPLTLVIRAPGGVVNPAATLGNNTCAGARARSTFPTRHPSRKASTLTRHEQTTSCPRSRQRINGRRASKRYYIFFCVCCHGGEETITGTYNSTRRKKKVIINHIYDAVREPT